MTLFVWPPQNINTTGLATESKQDVTNTKLDTLNSKDFATQTTLNALKTSVEARLSGSFVPAAYDYMTYTSGATSDTYVFKLGGAGGTTAKNLVINYTDSTKSVISNVAAT